MVGEHRPIGRREVGRIAGGLSASAAGGLIGEVGQQSAGHLPFERQARANGGFSILPTGTTDPQRSYTASRLLRLVTEQTGRSWLLLTDRAPAIAAIRLFRRKRPDAREMLPLTACECGAIHNNAHELPLFYRW